MKIHSIRKGFACNSSSSHSMLLIPSEHMDSFKTFLDGDNYSKDVIYNGSYDYSQSQFIISEADEKIRYLALVFTNVIRDYMGGHKQFKSIEDVVSKMHDLFPMIKDDLYTIDELKSKYEEFNHPERGKNIYGRSFDSYVIVINGLVKNIHVDHQSRDVLTLPENMDQPGVLNEELMREIVSFFQRDDVVILGGYDGQENNHPLERELGIAMDGIFFKLYGDKAVVRRDDVFGFWTYFSQETGLKFRFSLTGKDNLEGFKYYKSGDYDLETLVKSGPHPPRSVLPELVDLKVTDFCPFGCTFCYQASTKKGINAPLESVIKVADMLHEMKVFEVALGGGEPTLHPHFNEIVLALSERRIIPNVTTKNKTWIRNMTASKNRESNASVISALGAVAYSVESEDDARELLDSLDRYMTGARGFNIHFQYVMGTLNDDDFRSLVHFTLERDVPLTLLGFKDVGFGANYTPLDYSNWYEIVIEEVDKVRGGRRWFTPQIAIDTALAQESEDAFKKHNVPAETYEKDEGRFSMYIDVVKGTASPSSFCESDEYRTIRHEEQEYFSAKDLIDIYNGFEKNKEVREVINNHFSSMEDVFFE
jgi:MoaA/NifB/PqqE/SkfB family radical SAM enzyme